VETKRSILNYRVPKLVMAYGLLTLCITTTIVGQLSAIHSIHAFTLNLSVSNKVRLKKSSFNCNNCTYGQCQVKSTNKLHSFNDTTIIDTYYIHI
jgi:hypothetical protein